MGMERLISLISQKEPQKLDAYVVSTNTEDALKLVNDLRKSGVKVDFDMTNKKFTKQLEKASKLANYALILGEDEIQNGTVSVKNLNNSEQISAKREEFRSLVKNV